MGSQQGENSGRFLVPGDKLRRSAGRGVTRGQGALFCSGYNGSSQRTEKPLDMEATATQEMAAVALLRDAIFEHFGDFLQFLSSSISLLMCF